MARARAILLSPLVAVLCAARISLGDSEPPDPRYPPSQQEIYGELLDNTLFLARTDFGKTEASRLREIFDYLRFFHFFKFSEVYRYGLAVDSWQLGKVAGAIRKQVEVQPKWADDVLEDVADDIHAKMSFAGRFIPQTAPGSSPAPTSTPPPGPPSVNVEGGVVVNAETLDQNKQEVSGYEVWFCLKGLIGHPDRYNRFDRLSSPTGQPMAAGSYVFWTQKGSAQGGKVIINDIGVDAKDRWIDIPIP
jgi:hypothetical protein